MTEPQLLSLVLTLKPGPVANSTASIPDWWGRAAHALLLRVVDAAAPALAAEVHDGDGLRPFTASTLMGHFPERQLDPAGAYLLRLTSCLPAVSVQLWHASQERGPLAPGAHVDLDGHDFAVEAVTCDAGEHPWAGATGYAELAAGRLVGIEAAPRQIALQFTSPTAFRSRERHMPFPLPELVFGSLLDRWNEFAPIALPAEVRRYAEECLAISRYDLTTRPVRGKSGGLRVGAVGQITYTSLDYDRYWMSVLHALAGFALFSGVGAATSIGMGQCRQVSFDDRPRRPD